MSQNLDVRWGWIKGMYIYTILGAGGFGLGIIFVPDAISINIRRTPSRSSRFWGDWECLSIICAPINFGPPISSQIRACIAAPIELQNNLVRWCDYSDLHCREASYLRNIISRDLGHLYNRRLDCNTFLICLWQGGKAVDWRFMGFGVFQLKKLPDLAATPKTQPKC